MSITRRIFLRNSALAVVGTAAVPSFLARAAMGAAVCAGRVRIAPDFPKDRATVFAEYSCDPMDATPFGELRSDVLSFGKGELLIFLSISTS